MENNNKIKTLEMIQAIVNRMASNSFALKGWSVTLVSGIIVLSGREADKIFFLLAYLPIVMFWFLDSYYLRQERLYRKLYDITRKTDDSKIDFNLNVKDIAATKCDNCSMATCMLSRTEAGFYIPLALITALVIWLVL